MPTYGGDEVSAVVLDIGTDTTRAGYAGEDTPKCVVPTSYGRVLGQGGASPSYYIGDHGPNMWRPGQSVLNPLRDGIVEDWDAAERLMQVVFEREMRLRKVSDTPGGGLLSDNPLLVTEPAWNSKDNRERMIELAFETFDAPAYYSVDRATLAAFASGKGTALVVDVGDEVSTVTPVCDGFVLRKGLQKSPLAGSLLSSLMLSTLRSEQPPVPVLPQYLVASRASKANDSAAVLREDRLPGGEGRTDPSFATWQEMRVMHELKETVCEVYPRAWDDHVIGSLQPKTFEFPDGSTKAFGRPRFTIPEVLFNPTAFLPPEFVESAPPSNPASTIQTPPLPQAVPLSRTVLTAVERSDADLQSTLLSNVVVTGGSTLMTGLVERLDFELRAAAPGVKVKVSAPGNVVERRFGAWLGGSILASLGTFHQLWISKEEYQEQGRSVIHRRCK